MIRLIKVLAFQISKVLYRLLQIHNEAYTKSFGFLDESSKVLQPHVVVNPQNIFIYEDVLVQNDASFLIGKGRFIVNKHTGIAQGLTVLTQNHISKVGTWFNTQENRAKDTYKDVIVEEDVWIGANVILLPGARIGRGSEIGAGSVVRSKIPPYAIVIGNPAKVIGFKFTPEQIIEHETILYTENERLSKETLDNNYYKYFINRIDDISNFL